MPPPRHTVSLALTASASEPSAPSLLGLQHAACMLPGEIRPGWSRFSPRLLSDIAPWGNNAPCSHVPRKRLPRELGSVCTAPGGPANEQAVVMTLPGPWAITHNIGLFITSALITSWRVTNQHLNPQRTNLSKLVRKPVWPKHWVYYTR